MVFFLPTHKQIYRFPSLPFPRQHHALLLFSFLFLVLYKFHQKASKLSKMDDNLPFYEALDVFLRDGTTRAEDKASLLNYLEAKPFFSNPIDLTPIDEVTERLEISRKIEMRLQRRDPHWSVTAFDLAIVLIMPLDELAKLASSPIISLRMELESLRQLTTHCNAPPATQGFCPGKSFF